MESFGFTQRRICLKLAHARKILSSGQSHGQLFYMRAQDVVRRCGDIDSSSTERGSVSDVQKEIGLRAVYAAITDSQNPDFLVIFNLTFVADAFHPDI